MEPTQNTPHHVTIGEPHGSAFGRRRSGVQCRLTVVAAVATIVFFTGCASAPSGDPSSPDAALEAGNRLEAIALAAERVAQSPRDGMAKAILHEHADATLESASAFLEATRSSPDISDIEARFDVYARLVRFYDALSQVELPLSGGGFFGLIGGWEWTTEIRDVTIGFQSARRVARQAFSAVGVEAIAQGELESADALFRKVVGKFAVEGSEEQQRDMAGIAAAFASYARRLQDAGDFASLSRAVDAYRIAIRYAPDDGTLVEAIVAAQRGIADAALARGGELEATGTIDSLRRAAELYDEALTYDPGNDSIEEARERVGTAIAEAYYQEGLLRADAYNDPSQVEAAINAFDIALRWRPNYRDAAVWKERALLAADLSDLADAAYVLRQTVDGSTSPVRTLAEIVGDAYDAFDRLDSVAERLEQVDDQLRVAATTLSAISPIPVIGQVASVTSTAVSRLRTPVHAVSRTVNEVRDPYIIESRDALGSTEAILQRVISAIDAVLAAIDGVRTIPEPVYAAARNVDDVGVLRTAREAVGTLTRTVEATDGQVSALSPAGAAAAEALVPITDALGAAADVSAGIERVADTLGEVEGVTSAIDGVLQTEVSVFGFGSFSVEDAIKSTVGIVKTAAEALLDPIVDSLGIDLPSIPGLDELQRIVDEIESYHADALRLAADIADAVGEVPDFSTSFADGTAAIRHAVGL